METPEQIIHQFKLNLQRKLPSEFKIEQSPSQITISDANQSLNILFYLDVPPAPPVNTLCIALDQLIRRENQIISKLFSQLQLNTKVFARNCLVKKIDGSEAKTFINENHLIGFSKGSYYYGLFYKSELISVASFSNGRKMNRLESHLRSYELIAFCSKQFTTVIGGLTKLLKHFIEEKKPGDIMTYIDKLSNNGNSYTNNGFKIHSETEPIQFLVNKTTLERTLKNNLPLDTAEYYTCATNGNIKLVYTID